MQIKKSKAPSRQDRYKVFTNRKLVILYFFQKLSQYTASFQLN